jgi:hypothetical protein
MRRTSFLLVLLPWHTPANAQRPPSGIALGLHVTRFPNWSFGGYD